jgi:hypothetical protein
MKRLLLLTFALTALVATGAAVAHLKSADVVTASATFTATTASHLQTRTVTCAGQKIEISTGRYAGTAASTTTPDLAGAAELKVHSVYNTVKKLGWVEGQLKIAAADGRTSARFVAVNSDGALDGWVNGHAGHGDGSLLGSLSGSFTREGGFTAGAIGTGTGTNAALLIKRLDCKPEEKQRPSVFLTVRGQVDGLSATSISVKPQDGGASQACTIGDEKPSGNIASGDRVEMTCAQVGGAWVLKKVRERR